MSISDSKRVAVVGLGYVGLPIALAFAESMPTLGLDISEQKIEAYKDGIDPTGEMSAEDFQQAEHIVFSTDFAKLAEVDFVVVAVPTPIDNANQPDLTILKNASQQVGQYLSRDTIVIYESTVYPGTTEEVCVPILEAESGLVCGSDFKVGYSPERINPGDKQHQLTDIVKVVSGQDEGTLESVAGLYEQIIKAGVHRASSIKVAEAAKVIENTQRDLNIALINELSLIFDKMDIDTMDVLEAAGTKWNFIPFRPGLVGGHCIGVDPYYLTYKAEILGYHPEVILAGRRINDGMGKFVAEQTIKSMISCDKPVRGAKVLVMGIAFKENCSDIRNTRVIDIIHELQSYGVEITVWDPVANPEEVKHEYGIDLCDTPYSENYQAIIAAVPHDDIQSVSLDALQKTVSHKTPFMDVKSIFNQGQLSELGFYVWRL